MKGKNAILAAVLVGILLIGAFILINNSNYEETANNNTATEITQQETTENVDESDVSNPSIIELTQSNPELSTLTAAVVQTNLVNTLSNEGSYTVFAPTNQAFASLAESMGMTIEELLEREDLTDILRHHVISTEILTAELTDGQEIESINGNILTVAIEDDQIMVNDATVATSDIDASNGIVHIIDAVLLPENER